MAIVAVKQSSDFNEPDGTLRETWSAWDTAGTASFTADEVIIALRNATGLPSQISSGMYERKPWGTGFASNSVRNTLRLRDIGITMQNTGAGWMARVVLQYSTKWKFRRDIVFGDQCRLPVQRSVQPSQRTMNCWRDINGAAAFPTGTTLESTTDIGGTKLDERGNPVQIMVPQVTVTLTSVVDSFQTDLSAYDVAWSTYGLTLNDGVYMGFPAYSCLMTDIGFVHLEDEYYSARISWLYDAYFFFDQVAKADTDGRIKIDTTNGQASDVRWKRANIDATNWNNLLAAGTWSFDRLHKGEFGVTP